MRIWNLRFAILACLGGALSFAGTAHAQSQSVNAPVVSNVGGGFSNVGSAVSNGGFSTGVNTYSTYAAGAGYSAGGCSTGGCSTGGCSTGNCLGGGGGTLDDRIDGRLENLSSRSRIANRFLDCDLGDQWTLFGRGCDEPAWNIGGWFQFGYHSESNGLFNTTPDEFNLHQGWLFVEKVAQAENGRLGWGGRFDGVYGVDGPDTQSFGNPVDPLTGEATGFDADFDRGAQFGFAIPQLYAEVAGENWSAKVGHFYTLIGYEVVTAPDNFFYSHSITFFNSEPFTHTGAIGTFNVSDDVTLYGGWTLGWDSGFDQFDNGSNFLGGFSAPVGEFTNLTYITTIGDFGSRGDDGYSHSFVFDTQLTDRLNWVVQSDLLRVDETGEDNVGLNQYLLYNLTDCIGLGTRIEWWKGDTITGYAPHGGILPESGSHSYYAATFGVNYKPHANLIIRPEYRYDWSPALGYDEGYVGVDVIALY